MPPLRVLSAAALTATVFVAAAFAQVRGEDRRAPLRIGVIADGPTWRAAKLAVDEVNAAGGVLGRDLELVRGDGSHPGAARTSAKGLVEEQGAAVLLGGGRTTIRQAVEVEARRHQRLLLATEQHEGLQHSPWVVHLASAPNQQVIPAVHWATERFGDRVVIVRSTDPYSRVATQIIRDQLRVARSTIVATVPLRSDGGGITEALAKIRAGRPDVVLNTAEPVGTRSLVEGLHARGLDREGPALLSFDLTERDLEGLPHEDPARHWVASGYFHLVRTEENGRFVAAMRARDESDRFVTAPMESAYVGVRMWAAAVRDAGSADTSAVRVALAAQTFRAPEGLVSFDAETQHLWKTFRVGRVQAGGAIEVVASSLSPLRPAPFPTYRPRSEWQEVAAR